MFHFWPYTPTCRSCKNYGVDAPFQQKFKCHCSPNRPSRSVKSTEFFSHPQFSNYSVILQEKNFCVFFLCTRKNFVLEELPNSLEAEDMWKIRWILRNFIVKCLGFRNYVGTVRLILLWNSVKYTECFSYPQFPNYSVILRKQICSSYSVSLFSFKLLIRELCPISS